MDNKSTKKHKHLTLEDREWIETALREGLTFRAIAAQIGKDPSTISKEVLRHITVSKSSIRNIDPSGKTVAPEPGSLTHHFQLQKPDILK